MLDFTGNPAYDPGVRVAFKEWAVVVNALGTGQQILILRKGGIHEGPDGFRAEHNAFWLFPTGFHQQREAVLPEARRFFEAKFQAGVSPDFVDIRYRTHVERTVEIRSLASALALRGQHIWTDETIENRFEWGGERKIFALLLRVFRLPEAVRFPVISEYAGCRSWIELERDLPEAGLEPVLSDNAFADKCADIEAALRGLVQNS